MNLSKNFKFIHNVFHVFLLKLYRNHDKFTFQSMNVHDEKQWIIERILNSQIFYNKLKCLIKWKNCIDNDDEWISVKNLKRAKNSMKKFMTEYLNKFNQKFSKMLKNRSSSDDLKQSIFISTKNRKSLSEKKRYKCKRENKQKTIMKNKCLWDYWFIKIKSQLQFQKSFYHNY